MIKAIVKAFSRLFAKKNKEEIQYSGGIHQYMDANGNVVTESFNIKDY